MSPLIKPVNATSVGPAITGQKSVTGMTLLAALKSGNQGLAMTALGRGNQMPNGGVDANQNDVDTSQDDSDEDN